MRADRLLSLLLLLQARGRLTAGQLADELDVSVRTIYRDLDALSAAGVPVVAERGPGGGCYLLEPYRTSLTGLTADEARVLFMLSIPEPLVELGVSGELKAALLKLQAALPASRKVDEQQTRQRIHLDPAGWEATAAPAPHLQTLHRALWQDRRVRLTHRLAFDVETVWLVDPLGLVAKAGTWHLVGRREGAVRVVAMPRVTDAQLTGATFERPAAFDLVAFWEAWCDRVEKSRPSYRVTVRVRAEHLGWLRAYFAEVLDEAPEPPVTPDEAGTVEWRLRFASLADARRDILGAGGAVEVVAPRELRAGVADYAAQVMAVYERSGR